MGRRSPPLRNTKDAVGLMSHDGDKSESKWAASSYEDKHFTMLDIVPVAKELIPMVKKIQYRITV